MINFYPLYE